MYNPDVTQQRPLRALWTNDFWGQAMALPDSHKSYRPLAVLSLRLNHAWGGLRPWGYHVGNLGLHALAAAAVALLAWTVADDDDDDDDSDENSGNGGSGGSDSPADPRGGRGGLSAAASGSRALPVAAGRARVRRPPRRLALSGRAWAAWAAGLAFASHPVHVEPVASAVGRADLLSGALALGALLAYLAASPELRHRVGPCSGRSHRAGRAADSAAASKRPRKNPADAAVGWRRSRAAAAFGLALGATFAKELGVAAFGLFACHEIVEALVADAAAAAAAAVAADADAAAVAAAAAGLPAALLQPPSSAAAGAVWTLADLPVACALAATARRLAGWPHSPPPLALGGRSDSRSRSSSSSKNPGSRVPAAAADAGAAVRVASALGAALVCVWLHLRLHGGTAL
jgi:hypothetical protein